MMNQLTIIGIGLAVGTLARWLFLKRAPGGLPLALLLGMAGSMFAAFLAQQMGLPQDEAAWICLSAVSGAAGLLSAFRMDLSRRADQRHIPVA